ncbi:MAG: hypothetical protein KDA52_17995 [Planctomycetaceae bacterium]|nr:hypothetical protein [Planctomycetaceae bacterium]
MPTENREQDLFLDGIRRLLANLIPESTVEILSGLEVVRVIKAASYFATYGKVSAGYIYEPNSFTFCLRVDGLPDSAIRLTRDLTFRKSERKLLSLIPETIASLDTIATDRGQAMAQKLSATYAQDHVIVSRAIHGVGKGKYHTPATIIKLLQNLSFMRYESEPATSGFVFARKPDTFLKWLDRERYSYSAFSELQPMSLSFYDQPASYRYVDGKNAFYLIDNGRNVHGVVRVLNPSSWALQDRAVNKHLLPMLGHMYTKCWAAYVTSNGQVRVVQNSMFLQWSNNAWQIRDYDLVHGLLIDAVPDSALRDRLISCCFALSDLRHGTVMLIPCDHRELPVISGAIDSSELGTELRRMLLEKTFVELYDANALLQVLSSDGLTTISPSGHMLGCGDVIQLSTGSGDEQSGGGRTQAAIAASQFGTAIKVSEDGPITIYRHRKRLLTI